MGLPTDSTHLSDLARTEMIEQYGGEVETQFKKDAMMRSFVRIRPVRGTDTIIERRMGKTNVVKVTPGVRPDVTPTGFGRVALSVDTVLLARDNRSLLNEFQTDFDARMELARDHGKMLGELFDQAFLIQVIKGAGMAAPADLGGAFGAGKSKTLSSAGDELDPDKLYAAIVDVQIQMQSEDIDTSEVVVFVLPRQYEVLKNNNKLISRDYSGSNGDFAQGQIHEINGSRIVMTNRIPTAAIVGHPLSNAGNSNAYDVSATEAKSVAVLLHPKSLLAGETIPLSSDVYYNKEELMWFIDSWMSFGVTVKRQDVCGRVLKA